MMKLTSPLTFQRLFVERPWGGRQFEKLFNMELPDATLVGELWAISDRPEAQSIVEKGPLAGLTLHELWNERRAAIFGTAHLGHPATSFPILCKILDASEPLSLQVHPTEKEATSFHGEPKTECWYFLKTTPEARCYAGLKRGVTHSLFLEVLQQGALDTLLHSFPVKAGESLFIPSGRLHAMGKGIVAVEVEQNSDTTYRVFDWNRRDAQGNPRKLHLEEALSTIDFEDVEPSVQKASATTIADAPFFHVEKWNLDLPRTAGTPDDFALFTCLTGSVTCGEESYQPGDFFLVPAALQNIFLIPQASQTSLLRTTLPIFS